MKIIKDNWLIIVMLLLILGVILYYERRPVIAEPPPNYVWAKMDPNSSRIYTAVLMPKLNKTYEQIGKLEAQNRWLKRSLDKCLKKLETERGLEPILPKYYQPRPQEASEPWFVPYEEPNVPSLLEEPDSSVRYLVGLMGIRIASTEASLDSSLIKNFEERLKRLDSNQP
jgi:hypothetical protein